MGITGNVFITGGGSGIGRACPHAFAKAGARALIITDINLQAAQKTAEEARSVATRTDIRVEACELDVRNEEDIKTTVSRVMEQHGRIDYCVHSAGVSAKTFGPISATNVADFRNVLDVNVMGTFLITSTVTAAMKTQEPVPYDVSLPGRGSTRGAMVNLGSLGSLISLPNMVQYNTAKHGVAGLSKTAAIDVVGDGIRVNCVCPAWTATPMVQEVDKMFPGLEQAMLQQLPMGRLATTEEIADVVLFLCSPKSSYVTGCNMIIDGGMSLACRT